MSWESPGTGYATIATLASTALLLEGCVGVPSPEVTESPQQCSVEHLGERSLTPGEFFTWDLDPSTVEAIDLGFYENQIDTVYMLKMTCDGKEYVYEFYYNSQDLYNHFLPDAESFEKLVNLIFELYAKYKGPDEYIQLRNAKICLGREWKTILQRSYTSFPHSENVAYSFINETDGVSDVDKESMELVHTFLADKNNTSFHQGRETFTASCATGIKNARLGLPYSLPNSTRSYVNRNALARANNLTVPYSPGIDPYDLTEEEYNRFLEIFKNFPYSQNTDNNLEQLSLPTPEPESSVLNDRVLVAASIKAKRSTDEGYLGEAKKRLPEVLYREVCEDFLKDIRWPCFEEV